MDDREQQPRVEDEDEARAEGQVEDLDVDQDEAANVKGGRLGDPCDGGEIQQPRSTRW